MIYLSIENPALTDFQYTALAQPAATSDTVLNILSGEFFHANDIVLIEDYGKEHAEIGYISAIATDTMTLTTGIKFSHSPNTPVRLMPFDKFHIYQSNDDGKSYNLVDTTPIQPDSGNTVYVSSASSTSLFKIASYNSVSGSEGPLSEAIQGSGLGFDTAGSIIDRVYDVYNDPNKEFISDSQIVLNFINEGYADLWTRVAELKGNYLITKNDISITSDVDTYDLPDGLIKLHQASISYSGGSFVTAHPMDLLDINTESRSQSDPGYILLGKQIQIKPAGTGTLRLYYTPQATLLTAATDRIQLPSSYAVAKMLTDYGVARIYEKAYKPDRASYFLQAFENGVSAWLSSLAKRRTDFSDIVHPFAEGLE